MTSPESSATTPLPTAGSFTIQKTGAWNDDGLAESGETVSFLVQNKKRWAEGIDQLIEVLGTEQSVLRLSYIDANADTEEELVEERLKWLSKLI